MMRRNEDNDWATESRLDRQNAAGSEGWSRLPGDSGHDDPSQGSARRRRRPRQRSWVFSLALPVLVCIAVAGAAIYAMSGLPTAR